MKYPLISVVMSVYNGGTFLEESIESILSQTFRDFEFIIIDDTSTDNSAEIIKKYAQNDDRIRLTTNEINIGLTKSLNKGIKEARGVYIARQDADDVSLPDRLQKQFDFLEEHSDIFLCGTNWDYMDENERYIQNTENVITDPDRLAKELPNKNHLVHTSIMWRNDGVQYREKMYYAQDYDLYLNILSSGGMVALLPEKLVLWRMNDNAISSVAREKQHRFAQVARDLYEQRMSGGSDGYEDLDPAHILASCADGEIRDMQAVADKMILYLRGEDFVGAGEIYRTEYVGSGANALKKVAFFIFIYLPPTYRIYRHIARIL